MSRTASSPVSLRQLLLTRIAALVGATAILIATGFAIFGLLPMAERIAEEQFDTATVRIESGLNAVFSPATELLAMSRNWLGGEAPDLESPEAFNRLFQPVLAVSQQITSVVAGTSTGQGWLLLQQPDGSWRNRMTDIPRWGDHHLFIDRLPDGRTLRYWEEKSYDARKRPWFQIAQAAGKVNADHWTPPYTFFTTGDPGITASPLMRLRDGREFVLGFDLMLRDLSQNTMRASVGQNGLALVITKDERVLALPAAPASIKESDWLKQVLKPAKELGIAPLTAALTHWNDGNREARGVMSFYSGGSRWLGSIHRHLLGEQELWVLILAPATDFSPAWLPILSVLAAVLMLILGIALWLVSRETGRLTRPLEKLAKVSERIGQLQFQTVAPVRSRITEIRQLASAQEVMLEMLRNNQVELSKQAENQRSQIAALLEAETRLTRQNSLLNAIIENFPGGISVFDADLRLAACNPQYKKLLGLPEDLFKDPHVSFDDIVRFNIERGDYGVGEAEKQVAAAVERARNFRPHKLERIRPNGTALEIRGMPLPNGGFVTIYMDITERKTAAEALRIAATAFDVQEGMTVTDASTAILRVNRAFTEITGYAAEDVVGKSPRILSSGRHGKDFYSAMWESIGRTGAWQGEIWNRRKSGEIYPEWLTITAVRDDAGQATHYVGTFSDITLRKTAEDEIKNLAFYDSLTQLPNRRLLLDRLKQAMASSSRSERHGALLFIDLDNFKTLNDTLGHDIGDLLLQQVAQRLATCVREGDTVARLGGDEFVVMLEDLSDDALDAATQTETVGEKIIAALNSPYQLGRYAHHSTPSIGVTLFADHQGTIDDLMKRADLAMYQAKAAGRNTLRFFDPKMQAVVTMRAELENEMREAITNNQFQLHYQAQVADNGRVTGAEVLLRWPHTERGMVSPAEFIPLAEESGLILPLGHWVLQTACKQLAIWAARPDMTDLTVAVNISPRQLKMPNFVEEVLAILDHHGANPQRLKLELTESLLVDDVEDIILKMAALKANGVGFSLDDFGTGYSSLSYLKRLPLDQLKIDQSFVRDILTDPNDAAIAKMVVVLAESLGLTVIAEGVELEAQRDFLASNGCHAYQGYLFSRPLSLEAFEEYVKRP